jgi:glutathione synthase/RimK-type ligase-like ATP-grasp enzyme
VQWDSATPATLSAFDAVVVRSPWDWFKRRVEFRAFLAGLPQVTCPVFNAPQVLSQFADKRYLASLEARGVAVVPTVVLPSLAAAPDALRERGWTEAVLKPSFTANAFDAHRFHARDVVEVCARAAPLPGGDAWLLQPYLPQVQGGELSFIFLGDDFSHAVKKVPRAGDWRVQHEHGGVSAPCSAPDALVQQARAILTTAAPNTLYARVDGVVVDGRLLLMELELVEPELFFRFEPTAPGRFADALLSRARASAGPAASLPRGSPG